MGTLFLFVDGLGMGVRDPALNPMASARLRVLGNFAGGARDGEVPFGGRCLELDASMGVEGTPQSATGQTALLTGLNAAEANGGHLTGFPNGCLRSLLLEHSVLRRLRQRGRRVLFANAYRPISFLLPPRLLRRRLSATSVATLAARIPFRSVHDIPRGEALYHDFTNEGLHDEGYDLPPRSAEEAGRVLARLAGAHDFVLYEFFKTDRAGHAQDHSRAVTLLERYDRFLVSLLGHLDLARTSVLLASDHGNLEDLSHPMHTSNPAMGLVWGRDAEWAAAHLRSVIDVGRVIMELDARSPAPPRPVELERVEV